MRVKGERKEMDMSFFLHNLGYTFFNIGNLTYTEISGLMEAHNRDVDRKNKANNKGKK